MAAQTRENSSFKEKYVSEYSNWAIGTSVFLEFKNIKLKAKKLR